MRRRVLQIALVSGLALIAGVAVADMGLEAALVVDDPVETEDQGTPPFLEGVPEDYPPGLAKKEVLPPGLDKKLNDGWLPPGQDKKENLEWVPPGKAMKGESDWVAPGQTDETTESEAPGQSEKTDDWQPPGQAKKGSGAPSG